MAYPKQLEDLYACWNCIHGVRRGLLRVGCLITGKTKKPRDKCPRFDREETGE